MDRYHSSVCQIHPQKDRPVRNLRRLKDKASARNLAQSCKTIQLNTSWQHQIDLPSENRRQIFLFDIILSLTDRHALLTPGKPARALNRVSDRKDGRSFLNLDRALYTEGSGRNLFQPEDTQHFCSDPPHGGAQSDDGRDHNFEKDSDFE